MKIFSKLAVASLVLLSQAVPSVSQAQIRPSPTGWRGPVRDAGRPWLEGYSIPRSPRRAAPVRLAPQWQYHAPYQAYWLYDARTRVYWYYNPQTGTYSYRPAY
jgi:hypothetical protein